MSYLSDEVTSIARSWMKSVLPVPTEMIDKLTPEKVAQAVDLHYPGGCEAYQQAFTPRPDLLEPVERVGNKNTDPQIKMRAMVRDLMLRYQWAACHQFIRVDHNEDTCTTTVVIRVVHEDERTRRIIERKAVLRMLVFVNGRVTDKLEITESDFVGATYVDSRMRLTDEARYEHVMWEYFHCYRPGGEKTPLDGPEAYSRQFEIDPMYERIAAS